MEKPQKTTFSRWLEILQQESWQLELLISGFAIFLLAEAYEPVRNLSYDLQLLGSGSSYYGILYVPYNVLLGAWYVLIVNLIMHVLLRGLWISTIGLRYISGEIEFDKLNFSTRFDSFLKRRIVKFDIYIQQLERLCSAVFGFTFLILFMLISLGLFVLLIFIMAFTIAELSSSYGSTWTLIIVPILVLYIIGGAIYALDFITLGWLKKDKWFGKIYYPFYRFYSAITLSFIYRPIYYNLIDNRFGRKVVLFLIPYIVLFSVIASATMETESYLPGNRFANEWLNTLVYDDTWDHKISSYSASIPSRFIDNGFVELYLPYIARSDDQVISQLCPDLIPAERGVYLFGYNDPDRFYMDAERAIECHAQRFKIYVDDSLHTNLSYKFYDHPERENVGLLTILDVNNLERGEHDIGVVVLLQDDVKQDSLYFRETIRIPFWKE